MAEVTECTAADRDEFWQDTPQDATGATETSEQARRARRCACERFGGLTALCDAPQGATEQELLAYLAADKDEQEG